MLEPGEQEAEQVAGGLVGPVHVLDDQHDRLLGGQVGERAQHRVEQLAASTRSSASRAAAAGQEPLDGRVRGEQRVDQLGRLGGQPAERLGERQVGRRGVAEVDAVPDEARCRRAAARRRSSSAEQPGLADPGVAAERRPRRGLARSRPRSSAACEQLGEFGGAADERGDGAGHQDHLRPARRHRRRWRAPGLAPPREDRGHDGLSCRAQPGGGGGARAAGGVRRGATSVRVGRRARPPSQSGLAFRMSCMVVVLCRRSVWSASDRQCSSEVRRRHRNNSLSRGGCSRALARTSVSSAVDGRGRSSTAACPPTSRRAGSATGWTDALSRGAPRCRAAGAGRRWWRCGRAAGRVDAGRRHGGRPGATPAAVRYESPVDPAARRAWRSTRRRRRTARVIAASTSRRVTGQAVRAAAAGTVRLRRAGRRPRAGRHRACRRHPHRVRAGRPSRCTAARSCSAARGSGGSRGVHGSCAPGRVPALGRAARRHRTSTR